MTKRTVEIIADWSIPLLLLVGATVYIRASGVDLSFLQRFYTQETGWVGGVERFWILIKTYGPLPAVTITALSIGALIASIWIRRFVPLRAVAWFFVAVMAIGPGLVINAGFKQYWGRPRPLDLQEFNRDETFIEVWAAPVPGSGASFPSGHASTAFFLFTPYFVLRRRAPRWAAFFLALGLGYGGLMGLARMAAGAHFPSDILWSAGFVYLTGLALAYAMRIDSRPIKRVAHAVPERGPAPVPLEPAVVAPRSRQTATSR